MRLSVSLLRTPSWFSGPWGERSLGDAPGKVKARLPLVLSGISGDVDAAERHRCRRCKLALPLVFRRMTNEFPTGTHRSDLGARPAHFLAGGTLLSKLCMESGPTAYRQCGWKVERLGKDERRSVC